MALDDVPVLPSFPADALPSWVSEWVKAEAVAAQVPVDLPAMLVLAALATAAAGVARIQARPGWEEP
jgi:hypothetical protein